MKFRQLFLVPVLILTLPIIALSALIRVPTDQPTIQAGIDAAAPRDTVVVLPGLYVGAGNRDLDYGGKMITMFSAGGPDATFIQCNGTIFERHIGFNFHSGEDSTAILKGFTVLGAYSGLDTDSGAIICDGASPTVRDCVLGGNFTHGIRIVHNGFPKIRNCTITHNSGHGVYVNHFYSPDADLDITGSLINHNVGSGIFVHEPRLVSISHCTIVSNFDHGIYVEGMPPLTADKSVAVRTVTNTISAYNNGYGMGSLFGFYGSTVVCSDAFGNTGGNFHSFTLDPAGFSADPRFCDTLNMDYTLAANSFCAPEINPCGELIGAFDIGCVDIILCGDINGDALVNVGDLTYYINYIFKHGPPPVPMEAADVNGDGKINVGDPVFLLAYIFRSGPNPACPLP